jgi:hypothetical protein
MIPPSKFEFEQQLVDEIQNVSVVNHGLIYLDYFHQWYKEFNDVKVIGL